MAQDLYVVKAGLVAVHQQQFVRVAGYSSTHRQSRATSLCGFGGRRTLRVQVQSRTQHVPERTRRLPEYKRSKRTKVTAYELQGPGLHANEQDNEPLCNTRNKQTNDGNVCVVAKRRTLRVQVKSNRKVSREWTRRVPKATGQPTLTSRGWVRNCANTVAQTEVFG